MTHTESLHEIEKGMLVWGGPGFGKPEDPLCVPIGSPTEEGGAPFSRQMEPSRGAVAWRAELSRTVVPILTGSKALVQ